MNRVQAIEKAKKICQEHGIGPKDYQSAELFYTDVAAKTFIELEGGGTTNLTAIMEEKLYMPYTWRVRHFKEFEKHESTIIFTPEGIPYGFTEMLSENEPGTQLTSKHARQRGETTATTTWNIDLSRYHLVEETTHEQPSKRLDHTFVYEMNNETIGEATYRLTITVSGDKVTEIMRFIKIPESFNRRYEHMRSANEALAWGANIFMFILYILLGCCVGLYFLYRDGWLIWKQPIFIAAFIAAGTTLAGLNQLPFLWSSYNTAHSANVFLFQKLFMSLILFFVQTFFFSFIIMIAESLTRRAFGHHPQLWNIATKEPATSYDILERTLGGYLMVSFNIAFVVACYFISTRLFGWWTPSDLLFDPNVLATYAPWFSPLALSLNAGVLEECLFRAIPLAGAALLGNRFEKKSWWIISALIIQALVFGAAHANYPTQPAYGRIVELFIPSIIWGLTYLYYGLIPTIITHFTYDVIWFSLPIFASYTPGALLYKIVIIMSTILPLLVLLYARVRYGGWHYLSDAYKNNSWKPTIKKPETPHEYSATNQEESLSPTQQRFLLVCGIFGAIAWFFSTPFSHNGITLTIDKQTAINQANTLLQEKNIILEEPWKTLPLIFPDYQGSHLVSQHTFVWQEGKKDIYEQFLGSYLEPAHWTIRYAQFTGDIVQRAEEYKLMFFSSNLFRFHHQLPESATGNALTQQQARPLAHKALHDFYNLDYLNLIEISAQEIKHPHRTDWLFIFADTKNYPLKTGQARTHILISGDTVVDTSQLIHVPEEWERNYIHKTQTLGIITIIFLALFSAITLWIGIRVRYNTRTFAFHFNTRILYVMSLGLFVISIIQLVNAWPLLFGSFTTHMPLATQIIMTLVSYTIFSGILRSILLATIITYTISYASAHRSNNKKNIFLLGSAIGMIATGFIALINAWLPQLYPLWPNYSSLGNTAPLIATLTTALTHYIFLTIQWSGIFFLIDTATLQWQKNKILATLFTLCIGLKMITLQSPDMILLWIISGTLLGLAFLTLYRICTSSIITSIPVATGIYVITQAFQQALFNAYPNASFDHYISIILIACISRLWTKQINK